MSQMDYVRPYTTFEPAGNEGPLSSKMEALICVTGGALTMVFDDGQGGEFDMVFGTVAVGDIFKFKPLRLKSTTTAVMKAIS